MSAKETLTSRPAPVCLLPPAADMTPFRHWAAMCQEATYASQQNRAVIRSRRLRAAREMQPTLQPGLRGMKCGFRRRATAGGRLTVPSALS